MIIMNLKMATSASTPLLFHQDTAAIWLLAGFGSPIQYHLKFLSAGMTPPTARALAPSLLPSGSPAQPRFQCRAAEIRSRRCRHWSLCWNRRLNSRKTQLLLHLNLHRFSPMIPYLSLIPLQPHFYWRSIPFLFSCLASWVWTSVLPFLAPILHSQPSWSQIGCFFCSAGAVYAYFQ